MFAALAQRESEAISERMRWSYRTRIDKGRFSTNKAPFGYMLADGRLEINTEEAEVVKEIFDMSLQGESISDIAKRVSKMDIPTRDKTSYWQESSILYILHNEKYAGDCLLQKTYTAQELPRFRKRNLGKYRQVFVKQSHPAIIEREKFERVQELLKRKRIAFAGDRCQHRSAKR